MRFFASSTNQPRATYAADKATYQPKEASGCRACPVNRYCAVYAPYQALPPANCPFGPGPSRQSATKTP